MSTIKSSSEHLTLNADGAGKEIKFQANGVEKASISSAGAFTSTSIDATKLTGTVPNFTSTGIDDNATSTAITIDSLGNMGLGVVPPTGIHTYWTHQFIGTKGSISSSNGAGGLYGLHTTDNAYIKSSTGNWAYLTTDQASVHSQDGGTHNFKVAPSGTADSAISWTTAMTIDNSGDVHLSGGTLLIDNSTNTTVGLGVDTSRGSMTCAASNGNTNILVQTTTSVTGTHNLLYFMNTSTNVGEITTNGTSTSYSTSSDYRLKENVVPMSGSIDRLKALNPSRFNFISDPDTTVDGFLAHEAQVVVPECVTGDKDGMSTEEYEVTPALGEVFTPAVEGIEAVYETVVVTPAVEAQEAVMGERNVTETIETGSYVNLAGETIVETREQNVTTEEVVTEVQRQDIDGISTEVEVEVTRQVPVTETYEVSPAVEAVAEVTEQTLVTEATEAVAEVILESGVEKPEDMSDGQQWRETTQAEMSEREVPDYQGIDQAKLVPLLVATVQELIAEVEALKNA